jgi:hypothetical protein
MATRDPLKLLLFARVELFPHAINSNAKKVIRIAPAAWRQMGPIFFPQATTQVAEIYTQRSDSLQYLKIRQGTRERALKDFRPSLGRLVRPFPWREGLLCL